jgi:hypothetical protein
MAQNDGGSIDRFAGRLKWAVRTVIFVIGVLYVMGRLGLRVGHLQVLTQSSVPLTLAVALLADATTVLMLLALWQLAVMLARIEQGDRFSSAVTTRFRRFALLLFVASAALVVVPVFIVPRAPGAPIRLMLDMRDAWILLITGLLLLVARLLDAANRIERDLDEIV